jgi:pyruvate dehydrogenase E2 component (dihydrolipoamide acetyltransferase)
VEIFRLPDLGEGLPDAEIVRWHVQVGDVVHLDQIIVAMETAKAIVEVPSPVAGKIRKLCGNPGDVVRTGAPLFEFETANAEQVDGHVNSVKEDAGTVVGKLVTGQRVLADNIVPAASQKSGEKIRATPAVRALANRLHVDLGLVVATGPNGTITTQDVQRAEQNSPIAEDFESLKGVRRAMAQIMSQSHLEVVPVTILDAAKLVNLNEKTDLTVEIIKAIIKAAAVEPGLNAWFDGKMIARRIMKNVNLGLAMDSEDGLFVPVIHHADTLTPETLRAKIVEYKNSVHNRSIAPENLSGATITLSNFGKFGGRYANPIVVPPMVAILGVGKLGKEAVVIDDQIKICSVLPLSLSFDHRAATGGEATRFLAAIIKCLEGE